MMTLHGFAASNYYNKVKLALIEKEIAFDEVLQWADGSAALLAASPLGKIPYLETEHGFISESQAINEYLEATYPAHPLLPADLFEAAKVREIIGFADLYLEWEARRVYGTAFFGGAPDDATNQQVAARLDRAVPALIKLVRLAPFAAGAEFTLADCALAVHLPLVGRASKLVLGRDVLAGTPLADYVAMIVERPSVMKVNADRKANLELFVARARR
jgi:glutathione S-transferase